jgi:integrase
MGSVFRRGETWWVKYRASGQLIRESSGSTKEGDARRLLRQCEGAASEGRPVIPRVEKLTVGTLLDDLTAEYAANGRRSIGRLAFSLAHLRPAFDARRAVHVTVADVTTYITQRQAAGAKNATINRELAALKRAYSLALAAERIGRAPRFRMLQEDNVRQGFFERDQFEAVRRLLPDDLRGLITVAYITGWRIPSELLRLQWRQVDFAAGTLRLEPGTTKNKDGRMFVMTPELRAALEAQRAATESVQRQRGLIVPWVFHRRGKPIARFQKAWITACKHAGCPGRIPHDFRRTAVRNLERAGVPRSVAMKMVGHKTEAIYRRYAIVDEAMLREGAAKLAQADAGRREWAR